MGSEDEYSDVESGSEHDSLIATQTEREILTRLVAKYGSLSKTAFREQIVSDFPHKEILDIRKGLYELAIQTIPETPRGRLVIRKDRVGGAPANDKMAEDMYILLHYLQGDMTMDVSKCLSEKNRKELQNTNNLPSLTAQDFQSGNPTGASDSDSITLRDFCTNVMTEMRRDRDMFYQELKNLQKEVGAFKYIQGELVEIRKDIADCRDRVSKLEVHFSGDSDSHDVVDNVESDGGQDANDSQKCKSSKLLQKVVKKLQMRTSEVEQSVVALTSTCHDTMASVANNNARLTERMNNFDLLYRHSIPSKQDEDDPEVISSGPKVNSVSVSQSSASNTSHQHSESNIAQDNPSRKVRVPPDAGNLEITVGTASNSTTTVNRKTTSGLKGFSYTGPQQKYKVYFVSGISLLGETVDAMTQCLKDYIQEGGLQVKSIRKLKQSRSTMSVKVVVQEHGAECLLDHSYWPDGINCREWKD